MFWHRWENYIHTPTYCGWLFRSSRQEKRAKLCDHSGCCPDVQFVSPGEIQTQIYSLLSTCLTYINIYIYIYVYIGLSMQTISLPFVKQCVGLRRLLMLMLPKTVYSEIYCAFSQFSNYLMSATTSTYCPDTPPNHRPLYLNTCTEIPHNKGGRW